MTLTKTEDECSDEGITLGSLPIVHDGDTARGIKVWLDDFTTASFDLESSLACLTASDGQRFTLANLRFIDPETQEPVLGLALSYQQTKSEGPVIRKIQYEHLKSDVEPTYAHADVETWLNPPANERFLHSDGTNPLSASEDGFWPSVATQKHALSDLRSELLTLDLLQAHAAEIDEEIKASQRRIMALWKADFAHCTSFKCYVKTAFSKAPSFVHLLATHFSHHNHLNATFFNDKAHMNCSDEVERVVHQQDQQVAVLGTSADTLSETISSTTAAASESTKAAQSEQGQAAGTESDEAQHDEGEISWGRPGGRPPWARPNGRPPWAHPGGRPPWAYPGGRPPWMSGKGNPTPAAKPPMEGSGSFHSTSNAFSSNAFNHANSIAFQHRFKLAFIVAAIAVIFLFVVLIALFIAIRRFRNPRWQVEWATRREERMRRKLYRKAACKYKWNSFWQRFARFFTVSAWLVTIRKAKSASPGTKIEEKEYLIVATEEVTPSSNILTPQINNLRGAYTRIARLIRINRERVVNNEEGPLDSADAERAMAAARSSIETLETLPAYSLPPPSYKSRRRSNETRSGLGLGVGSTSDLSYCEESGSDCIRVIDGFSSHAPSTSGHASTSASVSAPMVRTSSRRSNAPSLATTADDAESSIITCSPRLSLDSERVDGRI